tara:strand:- start:2502 stop:4085 length:1584 start_codon:yes stop_codon:yes gene_type:complete
MTPEGLIIEEMFMIADKDGVDVPFKLNPVQRVIDNTLTGRDLYPKARQEGVSSYFLGRYTAACLARRNTKAVVISHEAEATQRMLLKVKYFLEHIKGPKAVIQRNSANEITFPKTNSMFYIGTAGSRAFGRGDTISHLHCSEYAYWPKPAELIRGLFQAVPSSGEIALESTGHGLNDYYHRCMRAYSGKSRYKLHFFNWQDFPEYTHDLTPEQEKHLLESLDRDLGEPELSGRLTPGQLSWRREKLDEMDYDLGAFRQEYPMSLDECFQASGDSIFYKVQYDPTDQWIEHPDWLKSHILKGHPRPGFSYVIGADVAAGVDKDSSSIEVFCLDTMEQVGEYDNNKIPPDEFAVEVMRWGHAFNDAFLTVEQNNHGLVTLSHMRGKYPSARMYRMKSKSAGTAGVGQLAKMGWRTSERTKPLMIGKLRTLLASEWTIHSPFLQEQLTTYVEDEAGKLGASDGCHDDVVIAAACAGMGLDRALLQRPQVVKHEELVDPLYTSLEDMIEALSGGNNFPIRGQHQGVDDGRS